MTIQSPPLAGVIGWPISHSKSPALHGYWLKKYGINGHFIPIGLPPEDFVAGVSSLTRLGFKGVNVTIPHKETALELADEFSARAKKIGAANTLFFKGNRIIADNTDGYGFIENLRQNAPGWDAAGPALILGAGGASRAIISAMTDAGCREIRLVNRTKERAEKLADIFDKVTVLDWQEAEGAMAGTATIINTTSLGMKGQPDLEIGFSNASDALVTDIVYNPLITPFLAKAKENGLEIVDGLGMLLHQAVPGFAGWFGRSPTVDDELRETVLQA